MELYRTFTRGFKLTVVFRVGTILLLILAFSAPLAHFEGSETFGSDIEITLVQQTSELPDHRHTPAGDDPDFCVSGAFCHATVFAETAANGVTQKPSMSQYHWPGNWQHTGRSEDVPNPPPLPARV